MQKYHHMTIAGLERDLPICPVNESLYIAGFVIFGDQALTCAAAKALLEKIPYEYDYMLTAEAKGIPLIHEMARQSGAEKYFLARKAPKLYMTGIMEVKVQSITTAKEQTLYLDARDAEMMRGKRILLVDDVISTGESLHALEVLVEKAGGTVSGRCAILAEGEAAERDDITYLEKLPLFDNQGHPLS
ncbi:MAG: adenine phosphoribosyltransferase [Clostridia bacterium]|nr:adenine phosphoribosyltransferase [Clostridia bacterium]